MLWSNLWLADPALLLFWLVRQDSEFTLSMLLRARSKGLLTMGPFSKGLLHERPSLRQVQVQQVGRTCWPTMPAGISAHSSRGKALYSCSDTGATLSSCTSLDIPGGE